MDGCLVQSIGQECCGGLIIRFLHCLLCRCVCVCVFPWWSWRGRRRKVEFKANACEKKQESNPRESGHHDGLHEEVKERNAPGHFD